MYVGSHSSHSSPWSCSCCSHSTFELSSFPAFPKFYWEIALTTCRGHGKYFAGTTLCLHTSPRWSFMWKSLTRAWIWSSVYCWLVMCSGQSKSQFWKKKNGGSTWQDGISHQLWSERWCQLLVFHWLKSLKNGGVSFHRSFFFYFSSLLWHSRRVWQIEIRGETKNFEHVTVSSPVFHTCKCSNPCCNFPNFEASMQWHHARFSHKGGGEGFFWCDLHSYVRRIM